jgi:ribosomal protein L22
VPSTSVPTIARRSLFGKKKEEADLTNPILEKYLEKNKPQAGPSRKTTKPQQPQLREGELYSNRTSLLFLPEREILGWREDLSPQEKSRLKLQLKGQKDVAQATEDRKLLSMNLDPDVKARRHLERKLVISGVKRHGRMTKAAKLLRTERQSLYKSHFLPTSTKKLQKVVNQIAGKTVSEALVQLRFSPKRVARDVIKGLEIAQNEAIAARGMGLAGEETALRRWNGQRAATDAGKAKDSWNYKLSEKDGKAGAEKLKAPYHKEQMIELKHGGKKLVRDPSEIYIDQAWVGPGESWASPEFRARGAINMLKHRTTSTLHSRPC